MHAKYIISSDWKQREEVVATESLAEEITAATAVPSTTATGTFFIDLLGVGPSTGCILPQCWHSTDCTSLDEGCLKSP